MRSLVFLGLVVALSTALVAAQPHVNGYACGGINFSKTAAEATVFLLDAAGKITTAVGTGLNNVHGLVMDHNNQLLMATNLDGGIYKIDPATGTMLGTLTRFPSGYWLRDIATGQNGNFYVTETTVTDAVFKVDILGNISTVAVLGDNPGGGIDIDIDSSHLLVQSQTTPDPLRLIKRDGSVITTLGTGFNARWGMAQHIPTGDVYSSSCCGSNNLGNIYMLQPGQSFASIWLNGVTQPDGVYSLKLDRASAANQELIAGGCWFSCLPNRGGLYKIDMATKTVNVLSTLFPNRTDIYEVEILYRRNVHSNLTGRGQWDVGIHIPEDAAKPYVMAVSGSGVRPGLLLPASGRMIYLAPDTLTFVGLTIGLAPFLTGTQGVLDATGRALAKLDMRALGPAANGVRLWFLVVTLDSAAPDGIKTVTDPHVIEVEGL